MTTRAALADATAGVAGSLVAMLVFYPIDVVKTNLQAEKKAPINTKQVASPSYKNEEISSGISTDKTKASRQNKAKTSTQRQISLLKKFTRGLHYKTAHTVTSSFVYFFLYSWIQSQHRRYHVRKGRGRKFSNKGQRQESDISYQPSTSDRLLLSAVAAIMNTILTLPLDVLAARSQTKSQTEVKDGVTRDDSTQRGCHLALSPPHSDKVTTKEMMDNIWDEANISGKIDGINAEEGDEYLVYSKAYSAGERSTGDVRKVDYSAGERFTGNERKVDDTNECHQNTMIYENNEDEISNPIFRIHSLSHLLSPSSLLPKRQINLPLNNGLVGLWKGLWPSLLLCSNPSIHFTVFDVLKESVLKHKLIQLGQQHSVEVINKRLTLSLGEAFIIGMIAKFFATVVTYPLIRAKVMLMVSRDTPTSSSASNLGEDKNENTMMRFLHNTFASDGIGGLYKGCQLQLIHTLLKSALLMMVRERISVAIRKLILHEK